MLYGHRVGTAHPTAQGGMGVLGGEHGRSMGVKKANVQCPIDYRIKKGPADLLVKIS